MRKSELIDIYILEILERRAHQEHPLTQKQIIHYLDQDYGVNVTRNTLSTYIAELKDKKYIAGERGLYRVNRFNDHELRLLIDGVLFGQHIPARDADILINKLKSMSVLGLKDRIKNVYYLEGINRTQNNRLYEMIDKIDEAIQKERRLKVRQCRWDADKRLTETGRSFIVDPYQLVTEKSRYYLICFVEAEDSSYHGKGLENLRIDRFVSVDILEETRRDIRSVPGYENGQGFKLDDYMKEHIYMFSGESVIVKLRIKTYNIGDFIDWFGTDFHILEKDRNYMVVSIKVNENAIKYWALQYGEMAVVLEPQELRAKIGKAIDSMRMNYQ